MPQMNPGAIYNPYPTYNGMNAPLPAKPGQSYANYGSGGGSTSGSSLGYNPQTGAPPGWNAPVRPPPPAGMVYAPDGSLVPVAGVMNPTQDQTVNGGVGGFGQGPAVAAPNAAAYDAQVGQAAQYAGQYGQAGQAALGNAAPQIAGLGAYDAAMGGIANTYGQIASGQGPAGQLAEAQYNQALGQSMNSNTAMARSATGGAIGQAGAERAALEGNATTAAGAAGQSAINQGQLQLGALGAEQGAYGARLSANQGQASLQAGQNAANYNFAGNLYGLQNNAQQGGLAALNSYNAALNQASGLQLNSDIANANATQGQENALMSLVSDEDAKLVAGKRASGDPGYAPDMADAFLATLDPKHFRYKDPSLEPSPTPHGGDYLGIFAQDLERAPGVGPQLVNRDPRTGLKNVNVPAATSAMLAGIGRLHERLSALEGRPLTSDENAKEPLPDDTEPPPPVGESGDEGLGAMTTAAPMVPATGGGGPPARPGFGALFSKSLQGSGSPILQQLGAASVPNNALANLPTANTANAAESSATAQLNNAPGGAGQGDAAPAKPSGGIVAGLVAAAEAAGIAAVMAD